MISKLIGSFFAEREDAEATDAEKAFLAVMNSIETEGPPQLQQVIASGFVRLMNRYAEAARAKLPPHCHDNYILFLDKRDLKRGAEHFFAQASTNMSSADLTQKISGTVQDLVGYFLLARSWRDVGLGA